MSTNRLTVTVDTTTLPDMNKALKAAADAFAEALGVAPTTENDWSCDTSVSASETRALACLAEAWTRIADDADIAFKGRPPERHALVEAAQDHIVALQGIVRTISDTRWSWMSEHIAKYRTTETP